MVHIYQRRPARAEASRKKSTGEQQKGASDKKTEGDDERQERSVVGPPRCRIRLILEDEPDEIGEEVVLALIEALPSSGQLTQPTEAEDPERERRERKRKGKVVAGPVKKKLRQVSSILVIHEGRQRVEEDDDEEEEAMRTEHRSKRRNDGMMGTSEQRPEMARIQFEKLQVHLTVDLLGCMITFNDPKLTKECKARVERGKKVRSGRRLKEETLKELGAEAEFLGYIT